MIRHWLDDFGVKHWQWAFRSACLYGYRAPNAWVIGLRTQRRTWTFITSTAEWESP